MAKQRARTKMDLKAEQPSPLEEAMDEDDDGEYESHEEPGSPARASLQQATAALARSTSGPSGTSTASPSLLSASELLVVVYVCLRCKVTSKDSRGSILVVPCPGACVSTEDPSFVLTARLQDGLTFVMLHVKIGRGTRWRPPGLGLLLRLRGSAAVLCLLNFYRRRKSEDFSVRISQPSIGLTPHCSVVRSSRNVCCCSCFDTVFLNRLCTGKRTVSTRPPFDQPILKCGW